MGSSWQAFLSGSADGHAVEIYEHVDELAASVARFLASGFDAGEPAIVAATAEHQRVFAARLADEGWDAERLARSGLLVTADARVLVDAVMPGQEVVPEAFSQILDELLARAAAAAPGRRVRAFGELVDVLVDAGRPDAALALEELWDEAIRARDLRLLCGYRLDVFDPAQQVELLPDICRTHSHVLPAHDADALERAVSLALEDTLGPNRKRDVYYIVGDRRRGERVPVAQDALMWVSANLPAAAGRVLAAAREHYRAMSASPVSV